MNERHMRQAIDIMHRAKKYDTLYMEDWQQGDFIVKDEEDLHMCGNKACFAGHVAVSPEWKEFGGSTNPWNGMPDLIKPNEDRPFTGGVDAIAIWLDIRHDTATLLVYGNLYSVPGNYSDYYEKEWHKVTPDDVIAKLEMIIEEGRPF